MNSNSATQMEEASAIHLDQVQNLIQAMVEGMEAIATNSLEELRASVARQEELCGELAVGSATVDSWQPGLAGEQMPSSLREIQEAIRAARTTVQQLCLQYSALLASSTKTAGMLSALYRYHMQSDGGARAHLRWEI